MLIYLTLASQDFISPEVFGSGIGNSEARILVSGGWFFLCPKLLVCSTNDQYFDWSSIGLKANTSLLS